MRYERFKEIVVEQLENYLPDPHENIEIVPINYTKANGVVCDGIRIMERGSRLNANLDLASFHRVYEMGEPLSRVLEMISRIYTQGMKRAPTDEILRKPYDQLKNQLFIVLENKEKYQRLTDGIVCEEKENLVLLYQLRTETQGEYYSCLVNDKLLEIWGVGREQLIEDAWENIRKNMPAKFYDLDNMFDENWKQVALECSDLQSGKFLYQLSNYACHYGAVYMFDEELMAQIAKQMDSNFYVLPASIHDVMIVPENEMLNVDLLREVVAEGNLNAIREDEWLSDDVYYFDKNIGSLRKVAAMEQEYGMTMDTR